MSPGSYSMVVSAAVEPLTNSDAKPRRICSPLDMFSHLGGDIDDVAETGRVLGDFLGANREHAISPSAARLRPAKNGHFDESLCSFGLMDEFLGSFESRVDLRRLLAAGLGEIRSSAAAAADHGREFLDDIAGLETLG